MNIYLHLTAWAGAVRIERVLLCPSKWHVLLLRGRTRKWATKFCVTFSFMCKCSLCQEPVGKSIVNVLVLRQRVQFLKCFCQIEVQYIMQNVFYLLKLSSISCSDIYSYSYIHYSFIKRKLEQERKHLKCSKNSGLVAKWKVAPCNGRLAVHFQTGFQGTWRCEDWKKGKHWWNLERGRRHLIF